MNNDDKMYEIVKNFAELYAKVVSDSELYAKVVSDSEEYINRWELMSYDDYREDIKKLIDVLGSDTHVASILSTDIIADYVVERKRIMERDIKIDDLIK